MNDKLNLNETFEDENVSDEELEDQDNLNDESDFDETVEEDNIEDESSNLIDNTLSKDEQKRLKKEAAKKAKEEKKQKKEEEREKKKQEKLKKIEERKKLLEERKKGKKKDEESSEEDTTDDESVDNQEEKKEKPKKEKKEKPKKEKKEKPKKEKDPSKVRKPKTYGEKMVPYDPEEDSNPRIKLYNEIARAAYNFSQDRIPLNGIHYKEAFRIFNLVRDDYPELFWMHSCRAWGGSELEIIYRCVTPAGKIDKGQINRKRNELRKAALPFIRGISRRTDPYQAILTVYRRLILTLDYDGIGLVKDDSTFNDTSKDDNLRSLHSALVTHKVVCAGYAVAFQYLMNMIGVTSAVVTSEFVNNSGHAFNVVRIKNKCYYVDPTWGDRSNTNNKEHSYDDLIGYDYFCVPYKELILTHPGQQHNHIPNKEEYPNLKHFDNTEYEYYRYHKAYFTRRDDKLLLDLFVNSVKNYDEKEMGQFAISFRTPSLEMMNTFRSYLMTPGVVDRFIEETKKKLRGTKQEKKLVHLTKCKGFFFKDTTFVITILFEESPTKKQKKKK